MFHCVDFKTTSTAILASILAHWLVRSSVKLTFFLEYFEYIVLSVHAVPDFLALVFVYAQMIFLLD